MKQKEPISIESTIAPQINFACHQNSVPLVRDLSITNNSESDLADLQLILEASPGFVANKTWNIDRIPSGSTTHITDRDTRLDGQYLLGLQEAMTGHISLTLSDKDQILARRDEEVEVLARNEWGGYGSSPELLAAFSMPNDAAVDRLLKTASDVLRRSGRQPELDGYQAHSRKRVWEQTSAIWSAIAGLGLDYAYPPASFEQTGQKVRTPSMIMDAGRATCLDSTLLFCAALEQAGLNSVIVLKYGHSFAGVWLQPEGFSRVLNEDVMAVRKRLALNELLLFETTLVTQLPRVGFKEATKQGQQQVSEEQDGDFQYLVDLARARAKRIRPIDFAQADQPATEEQTEEGAATPLEEAPEGLPDFAEEEPETDPETPRGRLDRWQRNLLDLSLRNPLLNYKAPKASLAIIAPEPASLEDRLADGAEMTIHSAPTIAEKDQRDTALHQQRTGEQLDLEVARDGLDHNRLYVRMEPKPLENRLVELYRKAKADLEEGGANTLFLAFGFLKWRREENNDRVLRAPLVLVPVEMKRKSARSGIRIKLHDDEPRFNTTLLEMLRQDFSLDIKGLDGPLPADDSGVDIAGIWNKMRQEIRDVEGFEVTEEVMLGTFSFVKYLMWKDLVDRTDQLKTTPVVQHLLDTPKQAYNSEIAFPKPRALDDTHPPTQVFTPLDCDSSQLAAVVASAQGKDFVMIGPPGTGKSQTIANMITQNLAQGRTVLFVSEKAAALNVVYRRLQDVGLGEFCLELHSNKAHKREVLEQLRGAWGARENVSTAQWQKKAEELRTTRDALNQYVKRLHTPHQNGWTLHRAIARIVADPDAPELSFSWPSPDAHDVQDYESLLNIAHRMDINAGAIGNIAEHPLNMVHNPDWSLRWQQKLLETGRFLADAAKALRQAIDSLAATLAIDPGPPSLSRVDQLVRLCQALQKAKGQALGFAFSETGATAIEAAEEAVWLLQSYRDKEQHLSRAYAEQAWRNFDLDALTREWQQASERWWPFSAWQRPRVRKQLRQGGRTVGKPDPDHDLPLLIELAETGGRLDTLAPSLKQVPGWQGFATDPEQLAAVTETARALREASAGLADNPQGIAELRQTLRAVVVECNDLLGAEDPAGRAVTDTLGKAETFHNQLNAFVQLAGDRLRDRLPANGDALAAISEFTASIDAQQAQLKDWCAWRRVRNEAVEQGLEDLAQALEDGRVTTGETERVFEVAYARWWARQVLDNDDVLRQFVPAEHEARIADFQHLDDEVRRLSAQYVRAKLCGQLPYSDQAGKGTELGILNHELGKKKRHKPLRQLITELPSALPQLTPCLLMSPLSISQYLPPDHQGFDLVIFDEASQITVPDAIGALARGKQAVVAGDPKQLPPTNFFARQDSGDDDDDGQPDLESILDEMHSARIPAHSLDWHYRSQNENLITFSNHRYYGGRLVTFPAAATSDDSVQLRFVGGTYERGGGRINRAEAEAIVEEIVAYLEKDHGTDGEGNDATPSLGVVTFNSEQQTLIENLLDEARRKRTDIERYFGEELLEPVFVKSLENVQGDERDIILFSVTYGPDNAGKLSMNFGPLNQEGGERRLNVAVTRARCGMLVFSSLRGEQIDLARTQARGVADFKHFLEFAERGPKALSEATFGSQGDFDSPFETAVARELRERGWQIHPQVGVSAFCIDLGVVHPEVPGRYLAGVECDGATYHRAATARDRDKVRESILKRLGWDLVRVWSTDFWLNPAGAVDKLDQALTSLLDQDRAETEGEDQGGSASETEPSPYKAETANTTEEEQGNSAEFTHENMDSNPETQETDRQLSLIAKPTQLRGTSPQAGEYRVMDAAESDLPLDPNAFYEPGYTPTLDDLIRQIIAMEGPILASNLVKRVSAVHGFQRTGRRIRQRVLERAHTHFSTTNEEVGEFFWPPETNASQWEIYRLPASSADRRAPNEIPMEELVALAQAYRDEQGPTRAMARALGIARLSSQHRERLNQALEALTQIYGWG